MIRIVNKYKPITGHSATTVYCGRPTVLSNKFSTGTRDENCDKFQEWFDEQVEVRNPAVMAELRRLWLIAKNGDLHLQCFCAPKRCHTESIKAFLDSHL